ncbi:hypothetical protein ABIF65_002551 [Bradyrhizobium japonicum]|uniref:DEAD/DEAH box helicase n=2 Tax=Bradyrhizobium TaxID=374 RepID=UPI001FD918AD|nr:DEAD/DEAH box helicase family protein [Bradyrhizobium japonicum]MCP1742291.1 hypothetical protein [Bradyrhizobium japonicum]MCP1780654.1 hypothetical protein [Bradyrhizobium japonicum]MCP1860002.1 hypothetical protein [Bradyrhizobium japonicum]MCP1890768.1 hypothetical protein [Bradyrhizobium japonicum]MCP1956353.1 hypothetical protein [Bradyrhizobium japonicum]
MAFKLRYYQRDSIDAVYDYWSEKPDGNPLIVIPTGGGKSPVLGTITEEMIGFEPQTRIVMATHVSELIEQNYAELMLLWPFAPAGIFSAGLGRREAHAQIVFGGIQTMWRHAARIGHVDLLIIDEAHMLPPDAQTMYGKFIAALKLINPKMLILGLTATPYRTNSGMLTDGDDAMFDAIVYEISIRELIEKGFLCPLVSKATATAKTMIDLSKLRRSGGEFTDKSLKAVFDQGEVTKAAVDEIIGYAASNERPRRSWLLFCAGVDHAFSVRDAIRERGYSCETVHGGMEKGERNQILEDLKSGKLTSVTNFGVLTTGTNIKRLDLIALLRATDSRSCWVMSFRRRRSNSPLTIFFSVELVTPSDRYCAPSLLGHVSRVLLWVTGDVRDVVAVQKSRQSVFEGALIDRYDRRLGSQRVWRRCHRRRRTGLHTRNCVRKSGALSLISRFINMAGSSRLAGRSDDSTIHQIRSLLGTIARWSSCRASSARRRIYSLADHNLTHRRPI